MTVTLRRTKARSIFFIVFPLFVVYNNIEVALLLFVMLLKGKTKWKKEVKTCLPTTIIVLIGVAFVIFLVPHMFQVSLR